MMAFDGMKRFTWLAVGRPFFNEMTPAPLCRVNRYGGFAEVSSFGCFRHTRYIPGWQKRVVPVFDF